MNANFIVLTLPMQMGKMKEEWSECYRDYIGKFEKGWDNKAKVHLEVPVRLI